MSSIVSYVTIAASLASAAYSASQQKKAAKKAAAGQGRAADLNYQASQDYIAYLQQNQKAYEKNAKRIIFGATDTISSGYKGVNQLINDLPSVQSFLPEGKRLSRDEFDWRTGIKRENLDFILGDTEADLRGSQELNAGLANLNESGFNGRFQKVLQSNILGIKAATVGEPSGSFANLSAQNLYGFSQQALGNHLKISDFFSREGTVDPISPLQTTFDLYRVAQGKVDMRINNINNRTNNLLALTGQQLGVQQNILNNANQVAGQQVQGIQSYNTAIGNLAGAKEYADAAATAAYGKAVAGALSSYSSLQSAQSAQSAQKAQANYYNAMTENMDKSGGYSAGASASTYQPTRINTSSPTGEYSIPTQRPDNGYTLGGGLLNQQ